MMESTGMQAYMLPARSGGNEKCYKVSLGQRCITIERSYPVDKGDAVSCTAGQPIPVTRETVKKSWLGKSKTVTETVMVAKLRCAIGSVPSPSLPTGSAPRVPIDGIDQGCYKCGIKDEFDAAGVLIGGDFNASGRAFTARDPVTCYVTTDYYKYKDGTASSPIRRFQCNVQEKNL